MGGLSHWVRKYKNADTDKERKRVGKIIKNQFNISLIDIEDIHINRERDYCVECGNPCNGTYCRNCFEHGKRRMIAQLSRYHQKRRYRERQIRKG